MTAALGRMFGSGACETFLGLPRADAAAGMTADVVVLGCDAATPYPSVGPYCAGGAAAIRAASAAYAACHGHVNFDLGRAVLPEGVRVADGGDIDIVAGDAPESRARIAAAIGRVVAAGAVPVLIGGDDSVQIPMLSAFGAAGRKIVVVQVDAHIDWRDAVEGERFGLSSTMRRASEMAHVRGLVQVGARGIGSARPADLDDARAWGSVIVPAAELAAGGFDRALAAVPEGADVVVCFDLDALDPAIMPAVIGRTAGGLGYGQALALLRAVAARARIAGFGLVEFMAERDIGGLGAMTAQQLLTAALGLIAGQRAGG